jgi:hypothetical protein
MNDIKPSTAKEDRLKALAADRKRILNLPPEKALDAIADHPYPVTLVQSMADEDLYFLVHDIGPEDALPVLAIASNEQWDYLLDMEGWEQDHIHPHQMTQWLARLLKADPDRFTHWIINQKQEETALYLFRNLQLHIREYEEDPGDIGDDYFTEDQTHYIRLLPYPEKHQKRQEERDLFVKDLLNRVSVYDYTYYRNLLLAAHSVIPAEAEEELFRQRGIRLAEKGLLPFDEAIGVYQPLQAADLDKRSPKSDRFEGRIVDNYPLPVAPGSSGENLFSRTLSAINDAPTLERLQAEFAGLCNQVISADQRRIRDKAALERIVRKVSDYISIGLEKAEAAAGGQTPYFHAGLVQRHLLSDLFRVGYGCALSLKWRADRWHAGSWYADAGLPISFWGEHFMGVLGGLLLKKPLCYDAYAAGELYREFATLAEIENTGKQLDRMIAFDDLLSLMGVEPGRLRSDLLLTYENLLLTLWANHHLNMDADPKFPRPLNREQFERLFTDLWQEGPPPRKFKDGIREIFLGWLADRSGLSIYQISERMGPALEELFGKIESELGRVKPKDLDPRFVLLFLLKVDLEV